jgi:hypothetical protein
LFSQKYFAFCWSGKSVARDHNARGMIAPKYRRRSTAMITGPSHAVAIGRANAGCGICWFVAALSELQSEIWRSARALLGLDFVLAVQISDCASIPKQLKETHVALA